MKREVVEVVDGLYFGEAPRWHEGRLWFSDFYEHAVLSEGVEGDLRTELRIRHLGSDGCRTVRCLWSA